MRAEIRWLMSIERMAGNLYSRAADFFKEDAELATFLRDLAVDEAWHYHVMGSAAEYIRTHPEIAPLQLKLDEDTRKKVQTPFLESTQKLRQGDLTKESIVECIGATEFSEWNDMFLYVVNSLKEESREFQYVAARMQNHLLDIQNFLETRPETSSLLETLRNLPRLWRIKILLVEDSPSLLEILLAIFSRHYQTDAAGNGIEGFEKIKENYYDVIISDIDMPGLNGIELYQEAVKHDPEIGSRFLFFSGSTSEEHQTFLQEHKLPLLEKPGSLDKLMEHISLILQRSRNRVAANAA
jgi:CheY-like chemotaxis protein